MLKVGVRIGQVEGPLFREGGLRVKKPERGKELWVGAHLQDQE